MLSRKCATIIIIILFLAIVYFSLNNKFFYEKYDTLPLTTSLHNFVNGITPAIKLRRLHEICKLSPGITYSSDGPQGHSLPEEFDLRKYGFLTPIMNQEMCGGCWAFGTVTALSDRINFWQWDQAGRPDENSGWKSPWRNLVLTPQYLLSCDGDSSASGCEGSSSLTDAVKALTPGGKDMLYNLPNGTFMYQTYPFDVCQHENGSGVVSGLQQKGKGLKCFGVAQDACSIKHMRYDFNSGTPVFNYKNWYPISTGDMASDLQKLKEEIYSNGPVIMGISVFSNMYDTSGSIKKGDIQTASGQFLGGHCVVCVGWGKDYLIIKNSWGPLWGMNGYWYQSSNDTSTLSFGGGSGMNLAAGIPEIPKDLKEGKIKIPIIPPGQ